MKFLPLLGIFMMGALTGAALIGYAIILRRKQQDAEEAESIRSMVQITIGPITCTGTDGAKYTYSQVVRVRKDLPENEVNEYIRESIEHLKEQLADHGYTDIHEPVRIGRVMTQSVDTIESDLKKAIDDERYERAAELRNQLNLLKKTA